MGIIKINSNQIDNKTIIKFAKIITDLNIKDYFTKQIEESLNKQPKDFEKVFIFTSFDIVNSTVYKQINNEWLEKFSSIYDIIETNIKNKHENIVTWKYVGDEILFYQEISNIEELVTYVSDTFQILVNSQNQLYQEHEDTKNILYLKGALWIAPVCNIDNEGTNIKNVIVPVTMHHKLNLVSHIINRIIKIWLNCI